MISEILFFVKKRCKFMKENGVFVCRVNFIIVEFTTIILQCTATIESLLFQQMSILASAGFSGN